jgi:uncharacterized protein (TIGR03067 family)
MLWVIPVFASLLHPPALPARADDAAADLKAMQGAWQLVEVATPDGPVPADELKGAKVTIKDDKLTLEGLNPTKKEFSVKLDPSQKPKAIDLTALNDAFKGKTTQGIYSLDGDTLKVCMGNKDTKARPKEFKPGKDGDLMVLTLKRVK